MTTWTVINILMDIRFALCCKLSTRRMRFIKKYCDKYKFPTLSNSEERQRELGRRMCKRSLDDHRSSSILLLIRSMVFEAISDLIGGEKVWKFEDYNQMEFSQVKYLSGSDDWNQLLWMISAHFWKWLSLCNCCTQFLLQKIIKNFQRSYKIQIRHPRHPLTFLHSVHKYSHTAVSCKHFLMIYAKQPRQFRRNELYSLKYQHMWTSQSDLATYNVQFVWSTFLFYPTIKKGDYDSYRFLVPFSAIRRDDKQSWKGRAGKLCVSSFKGYTMHTYS